MHQLGCLFYVRVLVINRILKLIEPLRSEKWRAAEMQRGFDSVFALPTSAGDLAELLSVLTAQGQVGSAKYILAEHSLKMLLAKTQAKATLNAGWVSAVGSIVAAFVTLALGYYIGNSTHQSLNQPSKIAFPTCKPAQPLTLPTSGTPSGAPYVKH